MKPSACLLSLVSQVPGAWGSARGAERTRHLEAWLLGLVPLDMLLLAID